MNNHNATFFSSLRKINNDNWVSCFLLFHVNVGGIRLRMIVAYDIITPVSDITLNNQLFFFYNKINNPFVSH